VPGKGKMRGLAYDAMMGDGGEDMPEEQDDRSPARRLLDAIRDDDEAALEMAWSGMCESKSDEE